MVSATAPNISPRALLLSGAALAVPVFLAFVQPGLVETQHGLLVWLAALVPTFVFAFYLGVRGAAAAMAIGLASLTITLVAVTALGLASPNLRVLPVVVGLYVTLATGIAVFAELLHKARRDAERLALVDPLTGLPNRRHAELILEREFAAAIRGRNLSVIIYDIDHFKMFNDQFGHSAGDEVLQAFADVVDTLTRRQNLTARYGGEEFITVLSEADAKQALIVANRVRQMLGQKGLRWGPVTVSAGVAAYREGMGSYQVLVAAADRALYAAKEAGRDRVEVARPARPRPSRPSLARSPNPNTRERVLVIDDDPDVRESVTRVLRQNGYDATQTGRPDEALRFFGNGHRPIHLVVTNVMMPTINGFTLIDRITSMAPDVRVVYLSSAMRERVSWPGAPGLVTRFVPMPVNPDQLLATVQETLATPALVPEVVSVKPPTQPSKRSLSA